MKRGAMVAVLGVLALGLAFGGGVLVGSAHHSASYGDLDAGIATATGQDVATIRKSPEYSRSELPQCRAGSCLRVETSVTGVSGDSMQSRLSKAGWVVVPEQQPECVADNPAVTGVVCSYQRGEVIVSAQVELPRDGTLLVWATAK